MVKRTQILACPEAAFEQLRLVGGYGFLVVGLFAEEPMPVVRLDETQEISYAIAIARVVRGNSESIFQREPRCPRVRMLRVSRIAAVGRCEVHRQVVELLAAVELEPPENAHGA